MTFKSETKTLQAKLTTFLYDSKKYASLLPWQPHTYDHAFKQSKHSCKSTQKGNNVWNEFTRVYNASYSSMPHKQNGGNSELFYSLHYVHYTNTCNNQILFSIHEQFFQE